MESINTSSVTCKAGDHVWDGADITVTCSDGTVVAKKSKLMATGGFFVNVLEDSDETTVDISQEPSVKIPVKLLQKALEFTELTCGFKPAIQKPLRTKQTMYQVTSPALARFADSFEKMEDDFETLSHMLLVADYLDNQSLIEILSAKLALVISHMSPDQIRQFFNIQHPFASKEEEDRVHKENQEAIEIYELNAEFNH